MSLFRCSLRFCRMSYETIAVQVSDRVATVTVNRPDKLNALNDRVSTRLGATVDKVVCDSNVGGIILTGAGRAFVAGADISELESHGPVSAKRLAQTGQDVFGRFEACPKTLTAGVHGC